MSTTPTSRASDEKSAVVVGGGLAGIAAAVELARRGLRVTLVETSKRLGGRATSFVDPASGHLLDNCQHVLMGCCTNLIDLYNKLGVEDAIEWHRKLYFAGEKPRGLFAGNVNGQSGPWIIDELEADDLPAPMHMSSAMMKFKTLSMSEKVAIARGMMAIMRLGKDGRIALHDVSFRDWLDDQNQPAGAIEKFWAVIVISALNELPEYASAMYALQVFQEGFLANEDAYVMGLSSTPLVNLYDPAEKVIEATGGRVMLGSGVEALEYDPDDRSSDDTTGRVKAIQLTDGTRIEGDIFVSAVPFDRLAKLVNKTMVQHDPRLRRLDRISVSPILGIHLWFDLPDVEPIMQLPHMIFMQSPLQWIFNKGIEDLSRDVDYHGVKAHAGAAPIRVQHLHGVISAAHDLVDTPAEKIIDLVVSETRKALPGAARAALRHARVVKEKRATFCVKPGIDRLRPQAAGEIANLFLAGDWCDTGWPATMEGAVRSGYLAAGAVLQTLGREADTLAPDLKDAMLYQFVSG